MGSSIFHGALAMDALKVSDAKMVVYLHPSKTKVVSESIKRELSSHLFKFSDTFDGVLLAYEVVEVPSKLAKILSGLDPYLAVRLKANLLLFAPKPDTFLEGKVVKIARESIHVVILGFSAAVITEEDIRDEFKFKIKNGQEIYRSTSQKRHVIKVGTMIRFLVKSFDEEILHVSGSLIPASTGSIRWLSKNSEEASRNSHKQRESEGRREERSTGTVDGGALSDEYHVLKKPRKQKVHDGSERTE